MWEITLKSTKQHVFMLEFIAEKLAKRFVSKVVIGKYYFVESCLSIGTKKENGEEVWEFLKRVLCDVFCQKFKEEFLLKNLTKTTSKNQFFSIFIKVFTYFDLELENAIVYKQINYSSCIVLESYLCFRLGFLTKKWQDVCQLWNNNQNCLVSDETFLNLLKFLIDNLEPKTRTVVLSFEDGCIVYENQNEYVWKSLSSSLVEIVSMMIDLSPERIVIHKNMLHKEVQEIICFLFENRIK